MVSAEQKNPIRKVLGLGFWVQGSRCFPWMAVNSFLKDGLNVDPSTLQLLQNSANLPMVGKPLYGLVSDAAYIGSQHRIPYIAIGGMTYIIGVSNPTISFSKFSSQDLISALSTFIGASANVCGEKELGLSNWPASPFSFP